MGQRFSSKELQDAMDKVIRLFEQENVEYALAYGTLLGIIRDNHPIDNDDDVDLFIPPDQWEKALEIMERHFSSKPHLMIEPYFRDFMVNNVQVDLYKLNNFEDRTIDCWNTRVFLKQDMYPFSQFNQYSVPKDPEKLLVHVYGEDWRVPRGGKDYPSEKQKRFANFVCTKVFTKKPRLGAISIGLIVAISFVAVLILLKYCRN